MDKAPPAKEKPERWLGFLPDTIFLSEPFLNALAREPRRLVKTMLKEERRTKTMHFRDSSHKDRMSQLEELIIENGCSRQFYQTLPIWDLLNLVEARSMSPVHDQLDDRVAWIAALQENDFRRYRHVKLPRKALRGICENRSDIKISAGATKSECITAIIQADRTRPFKLLSPALPIEVRRQIWKMLLDPDEPPEYMDCPCWSTYWPNADDLPSAFYHSYHARHSHWSAFDCQIASLLQVSRQMRHEVLAVVHEISPVYVSVHVPNHPVDTTGKSKKPGYVDAHDIGHIKFNSAWFGKQFTASDVDDVDDSPDSLYDDTPDIYFLIRFEQGLNKFVRELFDERSYKSLRSLLAELALLFRSRRLTYAALIYCVETIDEYADRHEYWYRTPELLEEQGIELPPRLRADYHWGSPAYMRDHYDLGFDDVLQMDWEWMTDPVPA